MAGVIQEMLDLLFPTVCLGCGRSGGMVVCARCLAGLASAGTSGERVCLDGEFCFDGFRAGGPYKGLIKEMVIGLKSSRKTFAFPLALLMVSAAGNEPCFLVPGSIDYVPSEPSKVAMRGYNPAQVLACNVASLLGRPLVHGLVKSISCEDQDRLPRSLRWENVSGVFEVRRGHKPKGSVLLVDDVLTTGATANECSSALIDSGADSVRVLVAARAVSG